MKSLYDFGGRCPKIRDVCMDLEPYFKVHNLVSVYPKSIILGIHIQTIQMRLKRITEQKVKGAIIQSKARWVEYGEKKHKISPKLRKKKG